MARAESLARLTAATPSPRLAIALVGPGRVGSRLLDRLVDRPAGWQLHALANSRNLLIADDAESGLDPACWPPEPSCRTTGCDLEQLTRSLDERDAVRKVVVDATASPQVAEYHVSWLEVGFDVVTANKWALAAARDEHRRLKNMRRRSDVCYECAATVGAGLPIIDTVRQLRLAGESIREIRGSMSGTMTCLVAAVNAGMRPSEALRQAHAQGLTEPDPRHDLDGMDVARKLVILAREASIALDLSDVHIESLVPPMLKESDPDTFLQATSEIDDFWRSRVDRAPGRGRALCFVGRVDHRGRARVGLERTAQDHPLARLSGAENRIEIRSDCYREAPLVIQGPGAGIEVTALALWSGLKRISECAESGC